MSKRTPPKMDWWQLDIASRNIGTAEEERARAEYLDEAVERIVVNMKGKEPSWEPGLDLSGHRAELTQFMEWAWIVHQHVLDEWRRLFGPEGSPKRRHRVLEMNYEPDETEPPYDYGKFAGEGWGQFWAWHYKRERSHSKGLFRAPSAAVPKAPLAAVYGLLGRFWIDVLEKPFWPHHIDEGVGLDANKADDGSEDTIEEQIPWLRPAERMFLLVADEMKRGYTALQCKRVHDDYYGLFERLAEHMPNKQAQSPVKQK